MVQAVVIWAALLLASVAVVLGSQSLSGIHETAKTNCRNIQTLRRSLTTILSNAQGNALAHSTSPGETKQVLAFYNDAYGRVVPVDCAR